jgi:LacI family transcriptional regulator
MSPTGRKEIKKELKKFQIPIVFIDRILEGIDGLLVTTNNESISKKAVEHFIQQGFENIGIILGPQDISTSRERLKGYLMGLKENRIPVTEEYIVVSNSRFNGGSAGMQQLLQLRHPPEAVFVTNGLMTLGAIHYLKEIGRFRLPSDMAFIGYLDQDYEIDWGLITTPTLTLVQQPTYEMGKVAAAKLLQQLINREKIIDQRIELDSKLVIRESSRRNRVMA